MGITKESIAFRDACGSRVAGRTFPGFGALFDELNAIARETVSPGTIVRLDGVRDRIGNRTRFIYLTMRGPCGKVTVTETRRGGRVSVSGVTVREVSACGEPGKLGI